MFYLQQLQTTNTKTSSIYKYFITWVSDDLSFDRTVQRSKDLDIQDEKLKNINEGENEYERNNLRTTKAFTWKFFSSNMPIVEN